MIHSLKGVSPDTKESRFIAWNVEVVGDVILGKDTGVWYSASLRGDMAPIRVGDRTNVQDNAVLHVDTDLPLEVGSGVTIGHSAILHGCRIGNDCLIGMGAIVLNGAEVGEGSVVGAGALVTEGKKFPPRSLIVGSPAKAVKEVDDQMLVKIQANARAYVDMARDHQEGCEPVG
ncbi:gamma carbonic anhydrase family protein [Salinispira pacifica]|uniref:Carbonic anhydrase, family 3 n=1 Tax=Salinispira pacifica TaxID=1307761 RepID=V5WM81_9SPIO|nr:gamma carbonic anhydrase family protein [Salinispira pacifica]AHC16241.1 carbonic anhydrase, family 3 [Salinispira pacifica]